MGPVSMQHRDESWGTKTVSEILFRKPATTDEPPEHRTDYTIPPFWLDDRSPLLKHVDVRMATERLHKPALNYKQSGSRNIGIPVPRKRWIDEAGMGREPISYMMMMKMILLHRTNRLRSTDKPRLIKHEVPLNYFANNEIYMTFYMSRLFTKTASYNGVLYVSSFLTEDSNGTCANWRRRQATILVRMPARTRPGARHNVLQDKSVNTVALSLVSVLPRQT
ncbi:hypothetical protein ANN_00811 [Periplaneta americana]|uniref:Uncharacterized protein n=1 Tax=Periplaneta americana TaxID=6978 RepID=A0ABQ8TRW1_PERAM|nr:hypothetical protein ANN_00811 [Periplaneta americana]